MLQAPVLDIIGSQAYIAITKLLNGKVGGGVADQSGKISENFCHE